MLHVFWILLESFGQSTKIFGHLCSSMWWQTLLCCVTFRMRGVKSRKQKVKVVKASSQQINIHKHPIHKSCPINSCFFLILSWPGEASRWPRYQRLNSPSIELERLDPHQSCKGVSPLCKRLQPWLRDKSKYAWTTVTSRWHAVRAQTWATRDRRSGGMKILRHVTVTARRNCWYWNKLSRMQHLEHCEHCKPYVHCWHQCQCVLMSPLNQNAEEVVSWSP